jgi:predicted nucleic acid-binding protein
VVTFIDTSSLVKKYVVERGSDEMEIILEETSEVVVAPIAWIEFNSAILQAARDKRINSHGSSQILSEAERDFRSYSVVVWNEALANTATKAVHRHSLAALDAIQLASGLLSKVEAFVTSDRKLFEEARKVISGARYIG